MVDFCKVELFCKGICNSLGSQIYIFFFIKNTYLEKIKFKLLSFPSIDQIHEIIYKYYK